MARKYKVYESVEFGKEVKAMLWDEEQGKWDVSFCKNGEGSGEDKRRFEVVINATGCLNNWKMPDIPGLDGFEGKVMHSANWDESWSVPFH